MNRRAGHKANIEFLQRQVAELRAENERLRAEAATKRVIPRFERMIFVRAGRAVYGDGSKIFHWDIDGTYTAYAPNGDLLAGEWDTAQQAADALWAAGFAREGTT